ncbi:MAG: DUF2339 domain-containing protein [Sulfuricella sp.]|nr:DUF2339 domain-containing protein [Sulfuricella sp.]
MELLGFIGLFYVVLLLVLPFLVWSIFRRLKKIERILKIAPEFGQNAADTAELLERVERLERLIEPEGAELVTEPAFPPPSVTWKAEAAPAAPPVSVPAAPEAASFLAVPAHEAEAPAPAAPVPSPMPELLEPAPLLTAPAETQPIEQPETVRKPVSQEEWEELVGGSWLNKLGVVVLVIGLALFLGYSLKYFGPAGRVAIGLAASFAMLFAGMLLERITAYMLYARGLIGGGWAALYFTTYAMHGLEAARIVADPLLGIILLGVVAVGMIVHSLRYRSEVVTGMAYFVAFFTLAISPVSGFSVFAMAPLAASLLVVAYRFSWAAMTVGGLIATYGIYFLFSGIGFPASPFKGDFTSGQATLAVYWLLFEVFDLLDIRKHPHEDSVARAILPLNAGGFVGVSLLHWMAAGRTDLHVLFAASALAYLVSALLRARIQAPSSFSESSGTAERVSAGSYEGAVTVAAALAAFAIFHRFSGLEISVLLLLEGEALFLAGLALRQPYLRLLGAVIFAVTLDKLGWEALSQSGHKTVAGVELHAWTPVALLTAALLYLNRGLFHPNREPRLLVPEKIYSFAATGVLLVVLAAELQQEYLGIGCLILAVPLFELGLHRRFAELRFQAYGVGTLALAFLAGISILGAGASTAGSPWLTLGLATILTYATAVRAFRLAPERLPEDERLVVRDLSLAAGTTLLAALLWRVLPAQLVAAGWGIEALLLIEVGFLLPLRYLRMLGNLVLALAFGRLFMANFTLTGETAGVSHRILTVMPFIFLFHFLSGRLRVGAGRMAWENGLGRLYFYAPALLAAVLIRFEFGRTLAVVGWAILGLALLYFGLRQNSRDLRWQSYVLAAATFFRCWATNFTIPESLAGLSIRLFTGAVVIASLYAAQFISPRHPEEVQLAGQGLKRWLGWIDLNARSVFAVLASVLLAALLYYEVSARFLTIAWALEGVILLAVGFPARERILRLSGLVLLLACIVKVFAYDLRELETLFRILSFIVLGLLLLGVSLIYTRYKDQLRRYF